MIETHKQLYGAYELLFPPIQASNGALRSVKHERRNVVETSRSFFSPLAGAAAYHH